MLCHGRENVRNATGGYSHCGVKTTYDFTQGPHDHRQADSFLYVVFDPD